MIPLYLLVLCSHTDEDPNSGRYTSYINSDKFPSLSDVNEKIVFYGSSTIRLWQTESRNSQDTGDVGDYMADNSLQSAFRNHDTVNYGMGGGVATDGLYYKNILFDNKTPLAIVWYFGENDIVWNKPYSISKPKAATRQFIDYIKSESPNTRIILLGPKASISRSNYDNEMQQLTNDYIDLANEYSNVFALDLFTAMKNEDSTLNMFFQFNSGSVDNLHGNHEYYRLIRELIEPLLPSPSQIWSTPGTSTNINACSTDTDRMGFCRIGCGASATGNGNFDEKSSSGMTEVACRQAIVDNNNYVAYEWNDITTDDAYGRCEAWKEPLDTDSSTDDGDPSWYRHGVCRMLTRSGLHSPSPNSPPYSSIDVSMVIGIVVGCVVLLLVVMICKMYS